MNTVAAIRGVLKRFSGDTVRFSPGSPLKTYGNDVLSDGM
jgi:hypothetical protein